MNTKTATLPIANVINAYERDVRRAIYYDDHHTVDDFFAKTIGKRVTPAYDAKNAERIRFDSYTKLERLSARIYIMLSIPLRPYVRFNAYNVLHYLARQIANSTHRPRAVGTD